MGSVKKRGIVLWIIILVCFFAAAVYLATGVLTLFKSDILKQMPVFETDSSFQEMILLKGAFSILLGVGFLIVSIGLLKTKWWARISLIVFAGIQIIFDILLIIRQNYLSSINLGIYLILALCLIFSKKIKENFNKKEEYKTRLTRRLS